MKRHTLWAIALLSIVTAGTAQAADMAVKAPPLPPAPALGWEGFYVGINGGAGWGSSCWSFVDTIPAGLGGPPAAEGCHNPNGGFAGGQVGYNFQVANWVIGVEFEEDWAGWQGSNISQAFPTTTNRTRMNGFGMATGRVGYAMGPTLIYAKGGVAAVQDNFDFFGTLFGAPISGAITETRWAGTAGAGLEYKFAPHWSLAAEYDFIFLGSGQHTLPTTIGASTIESVNQNMNMISGRLNYYFQ